MTSNVEAIRIQGQEGEFTILTNNAFFLTAAPGTQFVRYDKQPWNEGEFQIATKQQGLGFLTWQKAELDREDGRTADWYVAAPLQHANIELQHNLSRAEEAAQHSNALAAMDRQDAQEARNRARKAETSLRKERTQTTHLKGISENATVQMFRENSDGRHDAIARQYNGPSFVKPDAQPTELQIEYSQLSRELEEAELAHQRALEAPKLTEDRLADLAKEIEREQANPTPAAPSFSARRYGRSAVAEETSLERLKALQARLLAQKTDGTLEKEIAAQKDVLEKLKAASTKLEAEVQAEFLAMQAQAEAQRGLFGTDVTKGKKDTLRKPEDVVAPLSHDMATAHDGFGFRTLAAKPTSEQLALLYAHHTPETDTSFHGTPKLDKLPENATTYEGETTFRVKTDKVDALGRTMYDVYDFDRTGDAPKFVKRDAVPTQGVDAIKVGKDKFLVVFDPTSQKFELEAFEAETATEVQQVPRKHQKLLTFATMPTAEELSKLTCSQNVVRVANGKKNKFGAPLYDTYNVEEALEEIEKDKPDSHDDASAESKDGSHDDASVESEDSDESLTSRPERPAKVVKKLVKVEPKSRVLIFEKTPTDGELAGTVEVSTVDSDGYTVWTRKSKIPSDRRIKVGNDFFVVVDSDPFAAPSDAPARKLVPYAEWKDRLDAQTKAQLTFDTPRELDGDKDGSSSEGEPAKAAHEALPSLEEIAARLDQGEIPHGLRITVGDKQYVVASRKRIIACNQPEYKAEVPEGTAVTDLEKFPTAQELADMKPGTFFSVNGTTFVVPEVDFRAQEADITKFAAQPTKQELAAFLETSESPVFEVDGKVFEVPARLVRDYRKHRNSSDAQRWELVTSLDGTFETPTEVSVAELSQQPTADELAKMEPESLFRVGGKIFMVPHRDHDYTFEKLPAEKDLATMRPGTTFRVGDKTYTVDDTGEMEIVPAAEFDLQIKVDAELARLQAAYEAEKTRTVAGETPEQKADRIHKAREAVRAHDDEVKKALREYQVIFDAELARLKAAYEAEKTKTVAGETPEQKATRIHKAREAVRALDVDFERKAISEHQGSAPTPVPTPVPDRWYHNTGKRVGAVNVTVLLAATILQNMLEGFVGEASEDERTKTQKVGDMFKAIVSGSKHQANFMAAWHIIRPEASAEGEEPKSLWGRYVATLSAKPVFITGLSGLMLYDLFELAKFSKPKAKELGMKLGLIKKA